jgi:hypothetical protein
MKDNLFDTHVTPLDVVKVLLLIVTCFSTWNIISLITPPGNFDWVREIAAVGVVEGAFLGFEYATKGAKNKPQMQYATVGFFLSLTVIALFAGVSGLVEFGGESLLKQPGGQFMGIAWTVRDWVMLTALMVVVSWIFALAGIYRLYSLADPDKEAELNRNQTYGSMKKASNEALREAMKQAQPTISIQRALAQIRKDYEHELTPAQLETLLQDVESYLKASVHGAGAVAGQPATRLTSFEGRKAQSGSAPVLEAIEAEGNLPPFLTINPRGNGNGHHKNE